MMLAVGLALLTGVGLSLLASRFEVPALVLFLGFGMLIGSDVLGWVYFDDAVLAERLGSVALAVILFEGGLRTRWSQARSILAPSLSLATVGVILSALILGVFMYLVLDLDFGYALLIASIVGSTDAAAVFAVLAGTQLPRRLATLLEVESASNDPMAIFLTTVLLELLLAGQVQPGAAALLLVKQFGLGLLVGVVLGRLGGRLLNLLRADTSYPYLLLTLGVGLTTFGLTYILGGSGFLAVYVAGLQISERLKVYRTTVLRFHEGVAWVFQVLMFVLLGLLVFPSRLPGVTLQGLAVAAALMFLARPLAVWLSTLPWKFSRQERLMIGWTGLRGAVPIVLATFPLAAGLEGSDFIFNVVFFVVLTSALIQGGTLSTVARWLRLEADLPAVPAEVLEFTPVGQTNADMLSFQVTKESPLLGKVLGEVPLPAGATVSALVRGERIVAPRGNTRFEEGDHVYILVQHEDLDTVRELMEGPAGEPAEDRQPQESPPGQAGSPPTAAAAEAPEEGEVAAAPRTGEE
ncbi:MAG: potassium/proton antiporter [Thermaerobacter sp.]